MQLGVHHVDTLQFLAGPVVRVRAAMQRGLSPHPVEDTVAVLAEHAAGPVSYVGCAWVTPQVFWLRVCGTRAVATYELDLRWWARSDRADGHSRLWIRADGKPRRIPVEEGDMLAEELLEFGRCVRGEAVPEVGVDDGLAAVAVLEAALRSARTGQVEGVEG